MTQAEWEHIRQFKFSDSAPEDWPKDVMAISMEGLALFGINRQTGKLYWDGKEVVVRDKIRLGTWELRWVAMASIATAVTAAAEIVGLFAGK